MCQPLGRKVFGVLLVLGLMGCGDQVAPVQPVPSLDISTTEATYDCTSQSQLPTAECGALLALYNGTNGTGWTRRDNWLATTTPCSWYGVSCSGGHVIALNLNGNSLAGPIPLGLANLTSLQWLNLYQNQLSGNIPDNLGTLSQLRELWLYMNQLSGPIPASLGSLTALEELKLSMNQLTGPIPAALGNLSSLRHLFLNNNSLTGPIPPELGNLGSLQDLSLSFNPLGGTIPRELGALDQLRGLRLTYANLTGPLPAEIGDLTNLVEMELALNKISGEIPDLSRLDHLEDLVAFNNQFDGPIPATLGDLASIVTLDFSGNRLSGSIPDALGNLTTLDRLYLNGNQLIGPMPLQLAEIVEHGLSVRGMSYCAAKPGNTDLYLPDLPAFRAADRNNNGTICGVEFRTPPNQPPAVNGGGPYLTAEGTAVTVAATATDPNDDPLAWTWTAIPAAGVDPGASCVLTNGSTSHPAVTCDDDGTFTLTATVSDGVNPPVSTTVNLTVTNVAPTITTMALPLAPVMTGSPVMVSATWNDDGAHDTHAAWVEWDTGTGFEPAVAGAGTLTAERSSLPPGVYTVTVRVDDDDGEAGSLTATGYLVVYDPAGSFVTGGGWIWSPAGAYPADAGLEGKATFGFVSRYEKGATIPTGNTEFQFRVANFNFHSTRYQWLVVAGGRAQYKGSGTVNGTGDFGFLLTAVDGALTGGGPDRFRIKIWEIASGLLVYDNQPGVAEDSGESTVLGGGSITIHK